MAAAGGAAGGADWTPPVKKRSPKHISEKYLRERPLVRYRRAPAVGANSNTEEEEVEEVGNVVNRASFLDEFISFLNKLRPQDLASASSEELSAMVKSFKRYYAMLDNLIEIPPETQQAVKNSILDKQNSEVSIGALHSMTVYIYGLTVLAKRLQAEELASLGPPPRGGARGRRRATKKLRGRRRKASRRR